MFKIFVITTGVDDLRLQPFKEKIRDRLLDATCGSFTGLSDKSLLQVSFLTTPIMTGNERIMVIATAPLNRQSSQSLNRWREWITDSFGFMGIDSAFSTVSEILNDRIGIVIGEEEVVVFTAEVSDDLTLPS